jgi:hypothetical protein
MRDGTTWSVFLLSRKLDGQHDGYDFGDGSTPVTLELPFAEASSITLHRLTGDPRESNRHAHNIQPESLSLPASSLKNGAFEVDPATGGLEGGLPAGSIYIYVFEEDAGPADSDGDGLSDSDETRDLDPSTDGV